MGRQANGGSGGIQGNKRWSLIHGPRLLAVLLVISMIHVAASHNKKTTHDQGSNIIRSPRNAKTTLDSKMSSFGQKVRSPRYKAQGKSHSQSNAICKSIECVNAANEIKRLMNLNVHPCDDFYEYACGRFHLIYPFPQGFSYYSNYQIAGEKSDQYKLAKLKSGAIKAKGASKELQRMPSDLYHSCINLKAIDNLGAAPLKERITELGGWSLSGNWDEAKWDFNKTIRSMHRMDPAFHRGPVFSTTILPGGENKSIWVMQAGPALAKEHYLNLTSKTIQAYGQLIIDVVELLGGKDNTTAEKADEIIRFEAQLANVSATIQEWHLKLLTTKISLGQLQREAPGFDWIDYFNKLFAPSTITESELLTMPTLSYLSNAMKIVQNTPKSVLANYMVWYVIRPEIKWLSAPFRSALLRYKEATTGTTSEKKLSKKCLDSTEDSFKDVISTLYVHERHAELEKPIKLAKQIMKEAIQAFKENVKPLTWLDNATKTGVFEKVDNMAYEIGYPAYMLNSTKMAIIFRKYKGLTIGKETFFKNKVAISKNKRRLVLETFDKPIDNTLWLISPLEANAVNNLLKNRMTLTAAILKPPFLFSEKFLRAYSMGKFGLFASHEVMHGFGSVGRPIDKNGILRNYWSNDSLLEFNKRLKCYEKQYSSYKILGKWPINGKNTAEENIADSGALKIALKAYYDWAKLNPSETWRLKGLNLTSEQLFFTGFAQNFCSAYTEEKRYTHNTESSHADNKFRTIGPLSNSCEFAKAFKCKINSPMNPVEKCFLWSKEGSLV